MNKELELPLLLPLDKCWRMTNFDTLHHMLLASAIKTRHVSSLFIIIKAHNQLSYV